MYRRRSQGFTKHFDFILLDVLCLEAGYCIAYMLRQGWSNPFRRPGYVAMNLFMLLIYAAEVLLNERMNDVLRRGLWEEAKSCFKTAVTLELATAAGLFILKESSSFSRFIVVSTGTLFFLFSYAGRVLWKRHLQALGGSRKGDSMLVAANAAQLQELLDTLGRNSYNLPVIRGLIVLDGVAPTDSFPYPVVADADTMTEYITRHWVDELLIDMRASFGSGDFLRLQQELDIIAGSGVAVHKIFFQEDTPHSRARIVEHMGGYAVLTDSIRIVSLRQAFLKRCLDIAGGLAGSFMAVLIIAVVGPVIKRKSPGPILFRQQRIGRNGKPFTMYKIRSMCMNADELKAELAAANRVKDGMMFKLDNDPRIIGSRLDADGTYHKGIGNFIRDYSLDEFPNFWNVLRGDMSLVGTRPPTLDEWERYEPHHRARMTFRPGITGLWQISGRSDITDFDEVIRLDMEYISSWNAGRDFRILLETVKKVFNKDGAL